MHVPWKNGTAKKKDNELRHPQVGNERFTLALEWSGQADFASHELRDWYVGGASAGKTRSTSDGLFTFATVHAAGHMVRAYDSSRKSMLAEGLA